VYVDTDNDGVEELILTNLNAGEDVFMAAAFSVRPGDGEAIPSEELINNVAGDKDTAKFHGNLMTLPLNLAGLANPTDAQGNPLPPFIEPGRSTISYWIVALGPQGSVVDVIGHPFAPLRSDVLAPAATAFTSGGAVPAAAATGTKLTVTLDAARAGDNPRLVLFHHLNTLSRKAQVVTLAR
jgi:hypothetical protein